MLNEVHGANDWWVISDVHGCLDELKELIAKLPDEVKIAFVGDLVDRGPKSMETVLFVREMVEDRGAACVQGNHDNKAWRGMIGRNVQRTNGLAETMEEWKTIPEIHKRQVKDFLGDLPLRVILSTPQSGKLVIITHAGIPFHDSVKTIISGRLKTHCLFGEIDGTTDPVTGFPYRGYEWTKQWTDSDWVCVYGHTPYKEVQVRENTYCIDTGCAFGGKLTALNPFTKEIIQVEAHERYSESGNRFDYG